jgi:hypothetical protein
LLAISCEVIPDDVSRKNNSCDIVLNHGRHIEVFSGPGIVMFRDKIGQYCLYYPEKGMPDLTMTGLFYSTEKK